MSEPKFKVGDIVYVRETYRQNQNVVGCGIVTEIVPATHLKGEFRYEIKFVSRYEKLLKNCLN